MQAPLRSRTVSLPQSSSGLGFPSQAFPRSRRGSSPDMRPPRPRWFASELVPASTAALPRLSVRAPPWDRQARRAASPRAGVAAARKASAAFSKGVTPSSSLIPAHAPDLLPSGRRHRLARPVFAAKKHPGSAASDPGSTRRAQGRVCPGGAAGTSPRLRPVSPEPKGKARPSRAVPRLTVEGSELSSPAQRRPCLTIARRR